MLLAILIGFVLGFVGSIPVAGPIAVLVLERALAGRVRNAMGIAVGAAVAESLYAGAAFVGLGTLMARVPSAVVVARLVAVVVLAIVAWQLVRERGAGPGHAAAQQGDGSGTHGAFVGFTITALNPTLLATWSVVVATLLASGLVELSRGSAVGFPLGVCLGIATWLVTFARLVSAGGGRLGERGRKRLRYSMAVFVVGVAVWFAWQAARAIR